MPKFSKRSQGRLDTCHPRLVTLFDQVIKHYDCTILEGYRDKQAQDEMFRSGRSKLNYPKSKHNGSPSLAVDVVPYPINWQNTERMRHFAGYVFGVASVLGISLRWGGDWKSTAFTEDRGLRDQSFMDLPHFELVDDA
tara:strand:+ start:337 stop:750 length:414 start_codon:yes stop_codon:yes gene_type:complete